jgi:hypothetical protein
MKTNVTGMVFVCSSTNFTGMGFVCSSTNFTGMGFVCSSTNFTGMGFVCSSTNFTGMGFVLIGTNYVCVVLYRESSIRKKIWFPWAILVSCKKKNMVAISNSFSDLLKLFKIFADLF